jgi:imidazolonepropionase-like amidohydrolase
MRLQHVLLVVFLGLSTTAVPAQSARVTAITGATLIDGTGGAAIADAVVVIDGARIRQAGARGAVAVPADAAIVDATGKFLIPGLADMHHHLGSGGLRSIPNPRPILRRMLAVGVTTVFNPSISLKDFAEVAAAAAGDAAPFARFFSTGPIITIKGDSLGAAVGAPAPETPADAQAVVRDLKAAGVHALKVNRDDLSWSMKGGVPLQQEQVLREIVREGHRQNLKVFAHAPMLKEAKDALRAGVDGLLHGIIDAPVDQEFLALMKQNGASYVPTMGLYHDIGDVAGWARRLAPNWDRAGLQPPRFYEPFTTPEAVAQVEALFTNAAFTRQHLPTQRANVKTVFDAGIPVVLGTDTGFVGILIGAATQVELELLVEAGLSPADALRAATINAARMIGQEKALGSIEAGKAADLVVLDADPRADIRNVTRISQTFKGGLSYPPVDPAKPVGRGFAPPR